LSAFSHQSGEVLDDAALDALFRQARTHYSWSAETVPVETLHTLYDLVRAGPTSANCSPARFVFLTTAAARERLRPALSPGNVDKTMRAPVVVIVATDTRFFDKLPELFPHADARAWFAGNPVLARETAFRNATLQGAYLILAARALGLDCGPMSGFDTARVDEIFFPDRPWESNFLINLGHGDGPPLPRGPRLAFDDACAIL
jgi:3-hydroxypropanoate dehydrogenase